MSELSFPDGSAPTQVVASEQTFPLPLKSIFLLSKSRHFFHLHKFRKWFSDVTFTSSQEIIERWLSLVNAEFKENQDTCVGVHCVTGLGRLVGLQNTNTEGIFL